MTETSDLNLHVAPVADALINLLMPLVEEAVRRVHKCNADVPPRRLVSVKQAAQDLSTNPDSVRRLVRSGDLVGYPFPDDTSDLHVETASIDSCLARRREAFQPTQLYLAKTGTDGGRGGRR